MPPASSDAGEGGVGRGGGGGKKKKKKIIIIIIIIKRSQMLGKTWNIRNLVAFNTFNNIFPLRAPYKGM